MTAARIVYNTLSNAGDAKFREHLRISAKAPPPPTGARAAPGAGPSFATLDVEFREIATSGKWSPLFIQTEFEKAVGGTSLNWSGTVSYQLAIQNVRNGRKYFKDGAEPLPPAEEDISITVEAYRLLDKYLPILISEAEAKGMIARRGRQGNFKEAVLFNSLEYQPVVRTCTKDGTMMQNPMLYLKLKERAAFDRAGKRIPGVPDGSHLLPPTAFRDETPSGERYTVLTPANMEDACKSCHFIAKICSRGITGTAAGLFLYMYIDEMCVKRTEWKKSTPLTFGNFHPEPAATEESDEYQDPMME